MYVTTLWQVTIRYSVAGSQEEESKIPAVDFVFGHGIVLMALDSFSMKKAEWWKETNQLKSP